MNVVKSLRSVARLAFHRSAWGVLAVALLAASCSTTAPSDNEVTPGDYPNFSKPLTSAMDQLSDEQAQAQQKQLSALSARRRAGAISEAEYRRRVEEMRKLTQQPEAPASGT